MSIRSCVVSQFKRPSGPLGHVVGWIMQARGSNRERTLWTVGLLDVEPDDRILEFGCGPGLGVEACAAQLKGGVVTGLDHSQTMIVQATRRNRDAVAAGRVRLRFGGVDCLAETEGSFTKVFSANVVQFIQDKAALFDSLLRLLAPGGTVATTYQPRHKNPTRADAFAMAEEIERAMRDAGFTAIRIEERALKPVSAICVLGQRPY
ncbi:MAG: methyltransferase domain-containing protein [Roseiarcus sp.]